jgi:hypothetical protein
MTSSLRAVSLQALLALVSPPKDEKEAVARALQHTLFDLLEAQRSGQWVMLYGSAFHRGSVFLHSILVPARDLPKIRSAKDITNWSGNPWSSWGCGLVWGGGEPPRVEFHEPEKLGVKALRNGQK